MSQITVLDGGMGAELQKRLKTAGGLWSAQALIDAPDAVADVHRDYIAAGARAIITNTYSTIPSYLAKGGLEDRYLEYAELAGQIARRVADEADEDVLVLGSIPPLDESYRWDLVPSAEVACPIYEALARRLLPYVDGFVCETMSSIEESLNAVSSVRKVADDKPLWVAWTLSETAKGELRSGESVADAVAAVREFNPGAYLFNCTTPTAITDALDEINALVDQPIGAYPNRLHIPDGWTLDNEVPAGYNEMSVEQFVDYACKWQQQGAQIVGGCCGVGPEFIRALSDRLQ